MSGTGNTFRVASWIRNQLAQKNIATHIHSIKSKSAAHIQTSRKNELIGFLMPTHGFTAPWLMIKFALFLPFGRWNHAFVVATRAGTKFGRLFLPGIAGSTCFLISLILFLKGYLVRGVASFDMPSNWMSLHPGFKKVNAGAIIERTKPLVSDFIQRISTGKLNWLTINNLYELIWTALLSFISILYLIIGRFTLAKIWFTNNGCNGCKLCERHCPVNAIKMVGRRNPKPYWKYNCESCMRCMAYCPTKAIEASQPLLIAFVMISFFPFSNYVLSAARSLLPDMSINLPWAAQFALDLFFIYLSFFLSYYIFYFLTRIPWINTLMTYTTGTHFYRRYHEPETNIRALSHND